MQLDLKSNLNCLYLPTKLIKSGYSTHMLWSCLNLSTSSLMKFMKSTQGNLCQLYVHAKDLST